MTAKKTANPKLDELNALRQRLGLKPTQSDVNIDERIKSLQEKLAAPLVDKKAKKKAPAAEPEKVDEPKPAAKKAKVEDDTPADIVRLGDLCKRLKIEPRAARIRLRKAGDKVPATVGDSWRWASKDAAAIEAIITPKGDAAAA